MKIRYHHVISYTDTFENYDKILKQFFAKVASHDVEIEHTWSKRGTQAVQYKSCDILNTLETVQHVLDAQAKGFDAVIIGCLLDIGLKESREVASIPVVSLMESTMLAGCTMGKKFAIISFGEKAQARHEQLIDEYGLRQRAAAVRVFERSLEEMGSALKTNSGRKGLREVFMQEAKKAVKEEQAEVIIAGCGIMSAMCMIEGINKIDGIEEVPVLDTFVPALKLAETQFMMKKSLGINISRRGLYQSPPSEIITDIRSM